LSAVPLPDEGLNVVGDRFSKGRPELAGVSRCEEAGAVDAACLASFLIEK
jgi:hypothetical protein